MNHFKKITIQYHIGWIMAFFMALVSIGCSGTEVGNPKTDDVTASSDVETFSDDAGLETYLKDQLAKSVNNADSRLEGNTDGGSDSAPPPTSGDYSQTNIQEEGVDESDVVKTDGTHFFIARGKSFHVVDIAGDMEDLIARSVEGYVDALYLYGDILVVLYTVPMEGGEVWPDIMMPMGGALFGMPYWIPAKREHGVTMFDISDPRNPEELKTVEFDGYLMTSRLVNGKLHLVQQFMPELPSLDYWDDGTPEGREDKEQRNGEALSDIKLDQLIPYYRNTGDQVERPTVSAENFYRPVSVDGGGTIAAIVSLDLNDPDFSFTSVGMVLDAHIVYASTRALYIATHKHYYEREYREEATLFKFDLTGERVQCMGGGVIKGWILNQFSLGEYQDVLRVAATTGHAWGWEPTSRNHVYCLKQEKDQLNVVGQINDLAPGEEIYAARFVGERGYLVTYVKIDPLFTLNLSDPTAPEVSGELKVPGYSNYIHPYGDNYLITLGKDAYLVEENNMAWYQGVQLSIFNISNFSEPELLFNKVIGARGTSSEALYNHKAFTFWPDKDLLALPINLYEHLSPPQSPSTSGTKTFEGLYVYQVSTDNGFELLGRINTENTIGDSHWGNFWTRGIFADQRVYAVTDNTVAAAPIDQIEEETTIRLNLMD